MDLVLVIGQIMKKDKILINIEDLSSVEEYKKLGVTNFLFPLKGYSIGYKSFTFDELSKLNCNVYVLVNRLLTDEDIDEFLQLKIPSNIKGFIIEDIGLYEELKGRGYELINFQNHLNNNYKTVNYWLKYYDSLVISTDITREEIKKIVNETTKPLVLNTFGYPMIMYSRRHLVSNFYKHLDKEEKKEIDIKENLSNAHFFLKESEYGTAVFNNRSFDYRSMIDELDDEKIKFYLINEAYTNIQIIKDVIDGKSIPNATTGFLDKKTVYRVGDLK